MSPETARLWVSVFRDLSIVLTGVFLAVFEATAVSNPNVYVLGLAGTLFGVPAVLRADEALARVSRGKGKDDGDDAARTP